MTFLGTTSPFYGGGQVGNPANILTHIPGKPPATFRAPLGTISLDFSLSEAWMLVSESGGMGVWASITGGASGNVDTLTGNSGGAVPPLGGNINVVGSGDVTVTGNIGTNTLTISSTSSSAFTWQTTTSSPINLVANNGYNPILSGMTTYVLPATCPYGAIIEIGGGGIGSWLIMQNAGQNILIGTGASTVGVGGSIASTNSKDCIRLLCLVANTQFLALSSFGNLTVT